MTGWDLPQSLVVAGQNYPCHTDYRDILNLLPWLELDAGPGGPNREEGWYVALALFYPDFGAMPPETWPAAAAAMADFLAGGTAEGGKPGPRLIDWQRDADWIVAGVNRAAGCEVRALPYLHWWSFLGWFAAIGEGPLATAVAIRDKLRRGRKLESWELDYYRAHRDRIDLRAPLSAEERAARDELLAKLNAPPSVEGRKNGKGSGI